MSEIIDAVFENGILRPLRKITLKEGEVVRIHLYTPKRITKQFIASLSKLSQQKADDVHASLREIRDDRY
ncbi:MAG TPA: antitoxin family protein [Candidatus Hodarchaeales archaeon]|nr:antitoxin family protein [Candidatus Hodarchaeales archaeon]